MIDLLLLGNGAMMPLPNRWLSSLLVRCNGDLILFDCGEGTQIPWRRLGWGFRRLGTICFSHLHADHIAGLPGLLHTIANSGRTEPLVIFGPVETSRVVTGLRSIASHLPFEIIIRELNGATHFSLSGDLMGSVIPSSHRVPSLAYRVDVARAARFDPDTARQLGIPIKLWKLLQRGESVQWPTGSATPNDVMGTARPGISVGFVTDTRPTADLPEFLSGVDLLICEGTYGDSADQEKANLFGHMTFAQAATIAVNARAKSLWLTHFSPALERPEDFMDEAVSIFPATTLGYSGLTATINFEDP